MNAQPQQKSPPGKQGEYYTDMPVGEILRRARTHYGQTLNDVEAILRIRAAQLASIEEGKLDELPGRVYAIGFVRTYSEYLGLDGDKMVSLFKLQSVGNKARPELSFPVSAAESKLPGVFLIVASLVAVVGIVILFSLFKAGGNESAVEEIPSVSESAKTQNNASSIPAPQPVPQPAAATSAPEPALTVTTDPVVDPNAPSPARIVIFVRDNTWVEIRNSSGKAIISQVLNPGERYNVPDEQGLVLATGNIGGLDFIIDGQHIAPLGNKGDVARGIKLDPSLFKSKSGKPFPARTESQPVKPASAKATASSMDGAWRSAIKPAEQQQRQAMPPQPLPVQSNAPEPIPVPGAASGTVR